VIAADDDKNYAGMASVAVAHAPELDKKKSIRDIVHSRDSPHG
jgi:hypothetical protein